MKLYAISDLHLDYKINREALEHLTPRPEDWLAVAGDIGHSEELFHFALPLLTARFERVFWTPGNHDLWTVNNDPDAPRGEQKYLRLVEICRQYGVQTPEDPFIAWPGNGSITIAPIFCLYDYTFGPEGLSPAEAIQWAKETNVMCADERLLSPTPYPSRQAWCHARCELTRSRLIEANAESLVVINHYPTRKDLAVLPAIPRFSIWCGTTLTEPWHKEFDVQAVVYGHLHRRTSKEIEGVNFEEVSLGYPKHWDQQRGIDAYLREILSE